MGPKKTAGARLLTPARVSFCRPGQPCHRMPPGSRIAASLGFPKNSGGNSRRFVPSSSLKSCHPAIRLQPAKEKMQEWIRAGVELAWLIHGDEGTVYIHRAGQTEAEMRTGILKLAGEGPLAGFELHLTDIWTGL